MDYDRYDAFLHHIFKQTQGDAWFRPSEDNLSAGVCLRVDHGECFLLVFWFCFFPVFRGLSLIFHLFTGFGFAGRTQLAQGRQKRYQHGEKALEVEKAGGLLLSCPFHERGLSLLLRCIDSLFQGSSVFSLTSSSSSSRLSRQ